MKPKHTWVLIADAGRARILEQTAPGGKLTAVPGLAFETDLPPTHELVNDRQPRSVESVGHARHAISSGVDPHRKEKRKFIDLLAAELEQRLDSYDKLVLVAPPQALGDLRAALSPAVKGRVAAEAAKDLTKTPDHEIASHLDI